jgi:hypothetical protein
MGTCEDDCQSFQNASSQNTATIRREPSVAEEGAVYPSLEEFVAMTCRINPEMGID